MCPITAGPEPIWTVKTLACRNSAMTLVCVIYSKSC